MDPNKASRTVPVSLFPPKAPFAPPAIQAQQNISAGPHSIRHSVHQQHPRPGLVHLNGLMMPQAKRQKVGPGPAHSHTAQTDGLNKERPPSSILVSTIRLETAASERGIWAARIVGLGPDRSVVYESVAAEQFELPSDESKPALRVLPGHIQAICFALSSAIALKQDQSVAIAPNATISCLTSSEYAYAQAISETGFGSSQQGPSVQKMKALMRQLKLSELTLDRNAKDNQALRHLERVEQNGLPPPPPTTPRSSVATESAPNPNIFAPKSSSSSSTVHSSVPAPRPVQLAKDKGPVKLVSASLKDWKLFYALWKKQPKFSWALIYKSLVDPSRLVETKSGQSGVPEETFMCIPGMHSVEGIVVTWSVGSIFVARLGSSVPDEQMWADIKKVLQRPEAEKIQWDMKSQLKLLLAHGITCKDMLRDPRVLHWLCEPDGHKEHTMAQCWDLITEIPYFNFDSLELSLRQQEPSDPQQKPRAHRLQDAVVRAAASWQLYERLQQICYSPTSIFSFAKDLFENVEMPLLPILAEMEFVGVGFDETVFSQMRGRMEEKVRYLERRAYRVVGSEFQLTSTDSVADVLFRRLGLAYPLPRAHDREKMKTNKLVLTMIRDDHVMPGLILEYRKLTHTINTYLDSIPRFVHDSPLDHMKRVFATCHQTNVPTGRIAFENPNMQSIRHTFDYVPLPDNLMHHPDPEKGLGSPLANKSIYAANQSPNNHSHSHSSNPNTSLSPLQKALAGQKPIEVNIRNAFVPAVGFTLLACDYSQIELRVMAHLSNDPDLVQLLRKEQGDIFTMTTAQWLRKGPEQVLPHERSKTKAVCYGILYGKGAKALAKDLECSENEARDFMQQFKRRFAGINSFIDRTVDFVQKFGYVETLLRRRRFLSGIYGDQEARSRAKRQAINGICQGTAADIVKSAMNKIWWEVFRPRKSRARMVINLHDEIVFEIPTEELETMAVEIQRCMQTAVQLQVPLPVKLRAGPAWGSLAPIEGFVTPRVLNFQGGL